MSSADRFLDKLERAGLLDDAILAKLRKQVASSKSGYSAKTLAEALVKSGHLTKFQAAKLVDEVTSSPSPDKTVKPDKTVRPGSPGKKPAADDALGLAPLDDDEPDEPEDDDEEIVMLEDASAHVAPSVSRAPAEDDGMGLAPLDDDEPAEADQPGLESLDVVDGLTPADDLQPVSGLEPVGSLEPMGGLEPLGGLEAIDESDGLQSLGDTGLEPMGGGQGPASSKLQKGGPARKKPAVRGNVWDSKLLLVGGGALVLFLILGIALWISLTRGTAEEMLQAADEDYRSQAYSQAIDKYEKFLKRFADNPKASLARTKISTAKMWRAVEGSKDKTNALETAKRELPVIEQEEAFAQLRPELASILTEIADGFSIAAESEKDMQRAQELVDLTREAMVLVDNPTYVPTSQRKTVESKIEKINENVQLAERNINMNRRLTEAIGQMRESAEAGKTVQAFRIRHVLLNGERDEEGKVELAGYPELRNNPKLVEATLFITDRERELVKVVDDPIEAVKEDHAASTMYSVTLASRQEEADAGNANYIYSVLARGAVYGLDAAKGQVLWRRHVGNGAIIPPLPVALQAEADVIAVDAGRQELLRLTGTSGALQWRLPLDEEFFEPVVERQRALVSTRSGRLLSVDLESGSAERHVILPMELRGPPCVSQLRRLYQIGEHSNLYVLDDQNFDCREVYYLGHKPGTIAVPPVMALGHLFIAINGGSDFCELHILKADENGESLEPAREPMRLAGRVTTPLVQVGARVLVVTDLGAIRILEVNPGNEKEPVIDAVAPVVASFKSPLDSFLTLDGNRLWVANDRFTKFDVLGSRNQLASRWIEHQRDSFVAPPMVIGDSVYHLRRRKDSPAFTATASNAESGKLLWEVDLSTPPGLLTVNAEKRRVEAISMQAELFDVPTETLKAGILDKASAAALGAARTVPFDLSIKLNGNDWAVASNEDRSKVVVYQPDALSASSRLEMRPLKVAGDATVVTSPVWFKDGLIVPLDNGQVALADPKTGDDKVLPFQAPIAGGTKIGWVRPAVSGDDIIIGDQGGKLYRIGVKSTPKPHLEALAQADRGSAIASGLAAAGDTVYCVIRETNSDTIISTSVSDLKAGSEWALEGRVVWGPEAVGESVLVATDRQQLFCFETGQKQRWVSEMKHGALAGRPLLHEGHLLLASTNGVVWRISADDGAEDAMTEIGESLATGPVVFGSQGMLLIGGGDGTLHVIPALTSNGG